MNSSVNLSSIRLNNYTFAYNESSICNSVLVSFITRYNDNENRIKNRRNDKEFINAI